MKTFNSIGSPICINDFLKISGIYMIICLSNNKKYIGSTNNFLKRYREHTRKLENKKHYNAKLQNAYNKYGVNNFEFHIIQIDIPISNLIKVEQAYLDAMNISENFNISAIAGRPDNKIEDSISRGVACRGKLIKLKSPMGEIVEYKGIASFCRTYKLCRKWLKTVLSGHLKHYKGWCLPETILKPEEIILKVNDYLFINENGIIVSIKRGKLKKYCQKYGLNIGGLNKVWKGECDYYRGHSLVTNPQHRIIKNKEGLTKIIGRGCGNRVAKYMGLASSSFRAVLAGNLKENKGWYLVGSLKLEDVDKLEKYEFNLP